MDNVQDHRRPRGFLDSLPGSFLKAVEGVAAERLMWTGQLAAILVSEAVIAGTSELLTGQISSNSLIVGGAAAFIASFIVMPLLAHFVVELRISRESLLRSRELGLAEAKYREVYEGMMDGFAAIDLSGRLVRFNEVFRKLLGYEAAELLTLNYRDLTPAAWHAFEEEILRSQVLVRGYSETYQKEYRRKDGTAFPVELRTCLARDSAGNPTGMWAIVRDITERVRVEAALRDSERLLRESQRIAGLGSYVLDIATGDWRCSSVLDGIFGIDEWFVHTVDAWERLVHPEWRERMAGYFVNEVVLQRKRFDKVYKIVRQDDGQERWVHGLGELEFDAAGHPVRMIGTIHDVTSRMQADEDKAKLEAQLAQAQKMESVGRLAGGVAHDFNNLLTVINGYSGLMLSNLSADDPLQANLAEILHAGERAAALTRQLLAFSRKQLLQPRQLNLNRVIQGMAPMLERLMGEDIAVSLSLCDGPVMVHADPHQLEQVMMNLAVNSRDAMPGCGTLRIETAIAACGEAQVQPHPGVKAGRHVKLAVRDTGGGIDEATRPHIFEPFFTTKEIGKGTGLGLSIVHGIVVQSGGFIEVDGRPGSGAEFRIYLPNSADEAECEEPDEVVIPKRAKKETVLVVEDQEQVRKYASAVLRAYGYAVHEAESGTVALEFLERKQARIDLLLTDVVMPNLSGGEFASRVSERWPEIKVLFMSGYTDDAVIPHGEGVHFIQKPFGADALVGKVRAVLEPARLADAAEE
jgi:PAS domain S-box-containing protein